MVAHFPDFILIIKQNISVNSQKTDLKKKKSSIVDDEKREKCLLYYEWRSLSVGKVGKCRKMQLKFPNLSFPSFFFFKISQ